MQRRCGFHIRILLHRLWRSPLSEGASYIRSPMDSRGREGIPFCGGSKPPPYGWDTEGVLSVLVGCDNLCPPFEGGIKGGCLRITAKLECCETDKALIGIFVCINTPPYPFSLRLGHARALTTVQVVIHYPRAASLPQRGGLYRPCLKLACRNGERICYNGVAAPALRDDT